MITRDKDKDKKKKKKLGFFSVLQYASKPRASFLDYMEGAVDMSLMVAIDFTGSNGHPSDYQSLHHVYGGTPSQYQSAIRQIGNIVAVYDSDQMFPVWGQCPLSLSHILSLCVATGCLFV